MTPNEIGAWITDSFGDVYPKASWGETSFFVNPGQKLPSGAYFATLKESDGDNDRASNLNRDNVFRLNFGPGKKSFEQTFGPCPARPAKGCAIEGNWDFTAFDYLMPHPVYGWMGWMCILNPTEKTFRKIEPLLHAAYDKALLTVEKRLEKLT